MTPLRRIALWILYATAAAPLVFSSGTIYPYVVPRAVYLRIGVAIACAIGLYAVATRLPGRAIRERVLRDPFLLALVAYVVILLATSVMGAAPERSLYGDFQRMGGVLAWLHYLMLYVALRALATERELLTFFRIALGVGVIVSVIAIVQSRGVTVGILPGTGESRAIGTLGNAGYLGVYALLGVAVGGLVWIRSERRHWRALAAVAIAVDGAAVALAFSRAAVVGLGAGLLVAALAFAMLADRRRRRWALRAAAGLLLVTGAAALSVGGDDASPGVRWLAMFERGVGSRIAAWEAGARGVAEHPLTGLGAENFRLAFDAHYEPERFATDAHWNRAHNDLLESAVSAGIPGGVAWLALWGALAFAIIGARREGRLTAGETALLAGTFTAYLVYLLSWFQDQNSFALFIALAAYLAARWRGPLVDTDRWGPAPGSRRIGVVVGAVLGLLALADIAHHARVLRSGHHLARAAREARLLDASAAWGRALEGRPPGAEETVTEFVRFASALPGRIGERLNQPHIRTPVIEILERARSALAGQIEQDSRNPRLHRDAGVLHTVRYQVAGEAAFADSAVRSFERAIARAPGRLPYRHMLSEVHLMADRPGAAVEALERGLESRDGSGETYYYLAKALLVRGSLTEATLALVRSYELGYINRSRAVHDALVRDLTERGDTTSIERLREALSDASRRRSGAGAARRGS